MNNLFSIFDPQVNWICLNINWVRRVLVFIIFPCLFWLNKPTVIKVWRIFLSSLSSEFKINFKPVSTPGHTHFILRLFLVILLNNVGGIAPYIFTSTRHLTFSVSMALVGWLRFIIYFILWDIRSFLAHLVPSGTPYILIPFIVLIELVSRIIRPLTLSVRLAANLVAGHLLITLVRSPISSRNRGLFFILIIGLLILLILERAVAFIQAYVFRILRSLYLRERNSVNFNYSHN